MARPRKTIPRNGIDVVRAMAEAGATEREIASALQMSVDVWRRLRKEDSEAREAWEAGRQAVEKKLEGRLLDVALDREHPQSVTACIFMLKGRFHWRDVGAIDGNGNPSVAINLTLPRAMSQVDYARLIEVHPSLPVSDA